jgi:hypothetical protein
MTKKEEIANQNSCLNKGPDDELKFVLRGPDITSPGTVRDWVRRRLAAGKNHPDDAQIEEALAWAEKSDTPASIAADATYDRSWNCFHCGETFTTIGSARDHFGATPDREPGCLIRVKYGDECGLEMELRKSESESEMWKQRALQAEEGLEVAQGKVGEFERIAGGSHQALRHKLDSMQGRVVTADALIEGFRSRSPEIFAEVIG